MKHLILLGFLVACANAYKIADLIPSFSTGFVIKGHEAVPHSAPYIASISNSTTHRHSCGGTILSKDWVLTAAHCILSNASLSIAAGLHNQANFDNKTQVRKVDWIRVHKGFSKTAGFKDIALLHLSEPLAFNKYVQPASLPAANETYSGKAHLYGWGQPKFYVLSASKLLQTVETRTMDYNSCKKAVRETDPIDETIICTDSMGTGVSACNGDSGGPLVVEHEGAPSEVIGIVSWGYVPCGVQKMPSIYTRVASYINWIVETQNIFYNERTSSS